MGSFASVNGHITPLEDARVPVLDHGFVFGDSVYEVVRTYGGRPFETGRHLRRLRASADRLGIAIALPDAEILAGLRFAATRLKQVLEPAGAAALGALLVGRVPVREGETVAAVLSGGNVAIERLGELLAAAAELPGIGVA